MSVLLPSFTFGAGIRGFPEHCWSATVIVAFAIDCICNPVAVSCVWEDCSGVSEFASAEANGMVARANTSINAANPTKRDALNRACLTTQFCLA